MQSEPVSWTDYPPKQDELVLEQADGENPNAGPSRFCTGCQAIEVAGRWRWSATCDEAPGLSCGIIREVLCPACRRCREHRAAGTVLLEMTPSSQSETCLREIVHAESRRLVEDDPMQRVIDIQRQENGLVVTTTTIELARAIGEAVQRTMRGHLEMHYQRPARELRVRWLPWG